MLLQFYMIYSLIWFQDRFAKSTLEVATFLSKDLKCLLNPGPLGPAPCRLVGDEVLALSLLISLLMVFKDEL